jgi:hypothetical protein
MPYIAGVLALLRRGSNGFTARIRPFVSREIEAAEQCAATGNYVAGFSHLERAHVLGQASTREHLRVHWRMLLWALREKNAGAVAGQVFRALGAATKTAVGVVPEGNTGGTNVSAFRRMPIPNELAALIADARAIQNQPPR